MPFFFGTAPGTSTNIDSDVAKRFPSTGTGQRKFSGPDISSEQETRGVSVVSNGEHLVEQASSMKGVAMVAEQVATAARESLQLARAQITTAPSLFSLDIRETLSNFTENDLANSRDLKAKELVARLPIGFLDTGRISGDLYKRLPSSVFKTRVQDVAPRTFNPAVPQLDNVRVEMSKNKGTVDCFFSTLKFSLPLSQVWDGRVKAVRIFRSTILNPIFQRGAPPVITLHGMEKLSVDKMRSRSKSNDLLGTMEHRFREAGILNAISVLNPIDPETNLRISTNASDASAQPLKNPAAGSSVLPGAIPHIESFMDPVKFGNIDSGVAQDLNVLKNIRNQDPAGSIPSLAPFTTLNVFSPLKQGLLNKTQVKDLQPNSLAFLAVDSNNFAEFREIAFVSLDKLKSKIVGDHIEYTHSDESVGYGRGYRYYVLSVDKDMVESIRSRIVDVTIEGLRIPERPKRVFAYNISDAVAMNIIVDDQLVEKFEIFRKSADTSFGRNDRLVSFDVGNIKGFNTGNSISSKLENNYIRIGESLNGTRQTGATFYDRRVTPGRKYSYRVYSVDVFGNKSESPYEFEMYLPEQKRPNELLKPSLTVEIDAQTNKARVSFRCNDARVSSLFLARRDLTIKQKAFTTPGQVNIIKLGAPTSGHSAIQFEDVVLRGDNKDTIWTGYFPNDTNDNVFIDRTVSIDHVYQYQVYGIDKFGNATPYEVSKPVMIIRRPLIDAPLNLLAEVIQGPQFTVGGIKLSWQDGNVDISSEDRLGNRGDLGNSSVRTLYQIERRRVGEERWIEFPMIEDKQFFDPSESTAAPVTRKTLSSRIGIEHARFRPPLVEANQTYVYRVKALQTGSYQSNYGNFVEVFAALLVSSPTNFRLKASDTKISPFYIVLNWDTPNGSGVVDKWEIERSVVNNFAANKLNVKNPRDFQSLHFQPFRVVFHESSRFRANAVDIVNKGRQLKREFKPPATIFTGDHQFQDTSVSFGNTYFYRIRAVALNGVQSPWVYRGLKLTEESFERKIVPFIGSDMKKSLAQNFTPVLIPALTVVQGISSFGFQPNFSQPMVLPTVSIIAASSVSVVLNPVPLPTYNPPVVAASFTQQRTTVFGKK